ncbi:FAD-binding domain-containing protein [Aspergillus ibericus CBS 121593]|uniref:FAD-binding domain-containing protein n=1 Tax=Aspergillus ibericus CBS 121593 TaxID=1448316 RepID=A0A395GSM8_9EURO|nr:FAD-binding domain-containing protein [Aspergillus ibericus CBS 121593]RAK98439.1 FAD-binding domain-containing protein [Aspergillus ibericus CBS 121593]
MTPFAQFLGLLPLATTVFAYNNICDTLNSQIPDRVWYPRNQNYSASLSSYYTSFERQLDPSCIFRPTTTAEVVDFVNIITENASTTSSRPQFAIRGGGHTLFSAAANINGSVTVDMRSMNSLTLSPDLKTASIGAGAVFSDIYPQLTPYNLTVMGGRLPGIGAGGFTTGGGLNFLAREHGFSCDNIYGYEIVLANGTVIYASASSHHDLWLALKGGSNNFGIITRFDLAAFPQGLMWGGVIMYNYTASTMAAQAKAFTNFMNPDHFDSAAEMAVLVNYEDGGFTIGNSLFYTKPVAYPKVYQPFTSLPAPTFNDLSFNNVSGMVTKFGSFLPTSAERATELVYSFHNANTTTYKQLIKIYQDGCALLNNIPGLLVQFMLQPQPVTNGTNSLGLTPGETDLVIGLVSIAYDNPADDDRVFSVQEAIVDAQTALLEEAGLLIPFKYLNYADVSQDPFGSYGEENRERLREVSRRYDPLGVFQWGVPGGFKLFD